MKACGLSVAESYLPSRRTFDRRLKATSTDIKERIAAMGNLFVSEGLVKPCILAIDSTPLKANKGHVWHVSSMKEGVLPHSGIDTDARWGFSHTGGRVSGYKLHMVCSTDSSVVVPLTADVTAANTPDNQVYPGLTSSSSSSSSSTLSSEAIKKTHFMVADPGYDDQSPYDLSMSMGFEIVCPVRRYKNTPEERLKLVDFHESPLGKVIHSKRGIYPSNL